MKRMRAAAAAFLTIILVGMLALAGVQASSAQGGPSPTRTPQPSPTGNGGKASWTVVGTTFESNFPRGVKFSIAVSSTGGKLKTATLFWRNQPLGARKRANATLGADGSSANVEWVATPGEAIPQWAEFESWWVLGDEAGNSFESEHRFDEYADTSRRWKRAESQDIIVIWQEGVPDEIGQQTLDAMAKQREFYVKNWPRLLPYRPRAIIYADFQTWGEWNPGAGVKSSETNVVVAGSTQDTWGATAQVYFPQEGTELTAYAFVPHEVGHLYQYANGLNQRRPPTWFVEGDATYFELMGTDENLRGARKLAASGNLPSLNGDNVSGRGANALDAYNVGFAFFAWLAETYGPDIHYKVWQSIYQGVLWRDALERATNVKFVEMEIQFRTWLGAPNPIPPTPIPSPVFSFPPTPTPAK